MSAHASVIGRVIAAWVEWVLRRPLLTVIVVLGLTAFALLRSLPHLGINTDTADMISPELAWRQDFIAYRESFPLRDNNIVVVVDGPTADAAATFARDLADALEAEPSLFPTVFLQGRGEFFERNGLLYLPLAELEALADRLIEAQPLLGRLGENVSGAGIVALVRESLERDAEAAGSGRGLEPLLEEIGATLAASSEGRRRAVAWSRLLGSTAEPSTRQLLLVQPALDFNRVRPAREPIERLRVIADGLEGRDGIDVRLTGTLAMEHEELTSITSSASVAGIAALAMVVLVLLWALRSPVLLLIAVVTLLTGLSLTASFAAFTVGHLNLLSVAFAVLYVGLGVDFILHLSLRLKELRAQGDAIGAGLIETARGVGSSLLICAVTTAAGFFAFIPTDFDGISELGLISGGGMIISLFVSLTLLPPLIALLWRGNVVPARQDRQASERRVRWMPIAPRVTVIVAAIVAAIAIALLPGLQFDGNPIHLRDPEAESIRALEDLADDSAAPLFHLAVLVPDAAAAAATAEKLAALDLVERAQTVASLVPAEQDDKRFLLEDLDLVLGGSLSGIADGPPAPGPLIEELRLLDAVLGRAASVAGTAARHLQEALSSWLDSERSLGEDEALRRARALDADLRGNLVEQVHRLGRGLRAGTVERADLPPELLDRWVNERGQELVEVVPRENLNDNEAATRFVDAVRTIAPNATGLPVVYQEASATVTRAFLLALVYAFVIVSLLLLVFLRSMLDSLLVLAPIAFAAILTAGACVVLGLPLNFANIIALPLLIGVGVDSGIHMVHRMRTEPPRDGDPLHTSTSRAVFWSALTTIASFGNLAFASHVGMASMGQLLTLGMTMSLIAVFGLLPALMRLRKLA